MGSKKEFKTYSMSTTVREIERVPDLMRTIIRLEQEGKNFIGNRSDKINKEKYVSEIIADGFVKSNKVDNEILEKIEMNEKLSESEVESFKTDAPQKPGWSGRLSNYFNKTESLGLSYRTEENRVKATELGKLFLDFPAEVVQWSLINIPANNPFKRNFNSFTPFGIIAEYIKLTDSATISKEKLGLILSMHYQEQVKTENFNINIEKRLKELSPSIKINTVNDYVDEMMRTLVFSGMFSRVFVGIKAEETFLSNIDNIIEQSYRSIEEFENISTKEEMFNLLNEKQYSFKEKEVFKKTNSEKITELAKEFEFDKLKEFISSINKHEYLDLPNLNKNIKRYVVIEWLFALILAKNENNKVFPNLSLDPKGYPISHAGAGKVDIEVISPEGLTSVEITLITNRAQMLNSETTNLVRHAKSINAKNLIFIAPKIHDDVQNYFSYIQNTEESLNVKALSFKEFISNYSNEETFNF